MAQPGYYDTPANAAARYGIDRNTWAGYSNNEEGESDRSIYAKRLGLRDNVLDNYLAGHTTDWYDHTFRTGINQDYNASISGGSDRMNYYLSGGLLKTKG